MRSWRVIVVIIAVLLWVGAAPLAVAFHNCMAMGDLCEGSCGPSACMVAPDFGLSRMMSLAEDVTQSAQQAPSVAQQVAEPPPRPLSFSA